MIQVICISSRCGAEMVGSFQENISAASFTRHAAKQTRGPPRPLLMLKEESEGRKEGCGF